MGRRSDIDWEAVERLYVAGQLTLHQMAEQCGVAVSSITLKAKKNGWKQDLSAAIAARTQAKVSTIDVNQLIEQSATESAGKSAKTIKEAIEHASDVAAGIVIKHRAGIRLDMDRAETVSGLLEDALGQAKEIKDIVTVTQAMKNLSDVRCKLREQERVIYGLDKDKPADTGLSRESIDALRKLKAAISED